MFTKTDAEDMSAHDWHIAIFKDHTIFLVDVSGWVFNSLPRAKLLAATIDGGDMH